MTIIETERLIIRQLQPQDLEALYSLTGDAELMRYVGDNQPISRELTAKWIEVSNTNYSTKGFGASAVIDKATGEFIGYCGVVRGEFPEPEIIYAFHKAYWGKGIATEAGRAMLDYVFTTFKIPRILATIDPANAASVRIVEKLGMTYVGTNHDEHNLPIVVYGMDNPSL